MAEQLRVLLVEDSTDDAALLLRELKRGGFDVSHERVDTGTAIEEALNRAEFDVVISDHGMPSFSGTEALKIVRRLGTPTFSNLSQTEPLCPSHSSLPPPPCLSPLVPAAPTRLSSPTNSVLDSDSNSGIAQ